MLAPSGRALLDAWEATRSDEAARVTTLLQLADVGVPRGTELDVPLGRRNLVLLGLYERLVGPTVESVLRCPACATLNELSVPIRELRLPAGVQPDGGFDAWIGEVAIRFRLPTTRDTTEAAAEGSLAAGALALAERCLVAADGPLGPEGAVALASLVSEADPPAEFAFRLACVGCGADIACVLDPVHLVAGHLDRAAHALLDDVHVLAGAYHWSEVDILALSPQRRRAYLDRLDA